MTELARRARPEMTDGAKRILADGGYAREMKDVRANESSRTEVVLGLKECKLVLLLLSKKNRRDSMPSPSYYTNTSHHVVMQSSSYIGALHSMFATCGSRFIIVSSWQPKVTCAAALRWP